MSPTHEAYLNNASHTKTQTDTGTNINTSTHRIPHANESHPTQDAAVCCSVLQCVAVCCSVLQCVAANKSCPTYKRVMSHACRSHVPHPNEFRIYIYIFTDTNTLITERAPKQSASPSGVTTKSANRSSVSWAHSASASPGATNVGKPMSRNISRHLFEGHM